MRRNTPSRMTVPTVGLITGNLKQKLTSFKRTVWNFYKKNKREMDWRNTANPYHILVSEIMLQQTQVSRVKEKYVEFLQAFPTTKALAAAPLSQVFKVWKGLGYNRRAQFIKRTAEVVEKNYAGKFPHEYEKLLELPGIGQSTAGALTAFAFNKPVVFIETNIRTVFIHHFFADTEKVDDKLMLPLIEQSVDTKNPREWYYALYDYGTWIKQIYGNKSRQSKAHVTQSSFKGSFRELRAAVLHFVVDQNKTSIAAIKTHIGAKLPGRTTDETEQAISALITDGAVVKKGQKITVA